MTPHPFVIALALAASAAWAQPQLDPTTQVVKQPCPAAQAIRILISNDGAVRIDGKETDPAAFEATLAARQPAARQACVYREESEIVAPHPNAFAIMNALFKLRMPLLFFADSGLQLRVVKRK